MAKKHLSEDELKYVISADSSAAQKAIYELSKETQKLRTEERARRNTMVELEAQGKKTSKEYKRIAKECKEYTKRISENNKKEDELRRKLDINAMSMSQLRKQAKDLRREMDNVAQSLEPERYAELEKQLKKVDGRINELKVSAKSLKEIATTETALGALAGIALSKAAERAGRFLAQLKEISAEGIEMAEASDGVKRAFDRLDDGTILEKLRRATKNTVTDLELMKATVKADDFRIPLKELGKYLQFAQLKAQQTGQSVEYMTESIVTGLGRKSSLILDNLGLSAAEINEQVSQTGDFMSAVATIVDKQLAAAGDNYVSSADRAQAATVRFQNAQLKLGQTLLPLKEGWNEYSTDFQVSTMELIGWVVKHRGVLTSLIAVLTTYKVATRLATMEVVNNMTVTKASIVVDKMKALWVGNTRGAVLLLKAAYALLTGNIIRATAAMKLFTSSCKANLIGLLVAALTAAVIVSYKWTQSLRDRYDIQKVMNKLNEKSLKQYEQEKKSMEKLWNAVHNNNLSLDERRIALEKLQKMMPGYRAEITAEGKVINETTRNLEEMNEALLKNIDLKNLREELFLRYKKIEALESLPAMKDTSLMGSMARESINARLANERKALNELKDEYKKLYQETMLPYVFKQNNIEDAYNKEREVEMTSKIVRLEKERQKVHNTWLEDTDENIAKKNRELEQLDEEIRKLKARGTIKAAEENRRQKDDVSKKVEAEAEKEAIRQLQVQRDETLANEQRTHNAALNAYRLMLHNKQISQEQFEIWEVAHSSNLADRRLSIEEEYARKSEALDIKDENLKEQAVRNAAERVEQAEQQSFDARLKAEQTFRSNIDALRQIAEQAPTTPEAKLKAEYDTKLQLAEAFYTASLKYAKEHGQDEAEVTELYNQAKLNLEKKYQEEKKELTERTTDELKALQGNDLSKQFTDIYNSIQQLKEAIEQSDFGGMLQHIQAIVNSVLGGLSNAFNTFKQIEIDNVEAKYDAEIEAAQGNVDKVEQLEKEKAQKKLDIEKKYADVQFAVKASQIIANTALAIMMALGQLGPIAGPIAAGLMAATGAVQLAAANAERDKVKNMTLSDSSSGSSHTGARVATGRESGGKIDVRRAQDGKLFPDADYAPDARGFIDRPTVIVGEGPAGQSKEWVASNAAVNNPTVAPILDILDKSQQAGSIRTLDLNQVIRARMAGYSSGGSIDKPVSAAPTQPSGAGYQLPPKLMERFANAIIHLDEVGVDASVALSEFEKKKKLRDRSRKIGSK